MGRKTRTLKASAKLLIIILSVIMVAVLSVSAYVGSIWYVDNKMPAFSKGGEIHIYEDDNLETVLARFNETLRPLHPQSLRRSMNIERSYERLHPGSYKFLPTHTARYVARAITRGWQTPVHLTIAGSIRSKEQLAEKIASQMMIDTMEVLNGLNDSLLLSAFGTTPTKVFEIILPDTYEVYWDWDMSKLMKRFKKEHELYWNKDRRAKAQARGLSPEEVSVLASIVAEETHRPEEYPKVASVYLNRLRKGMKLQACPTVCYIYDYKIRRVLFSHLANPSPYNTYLHQGLPPSPICLPGKEHIEAVLNPDEHNYLFFCANSEFDGTNVFAETLAEHQENARRYHQAFEEYEARKAAEAAEAAAAAAAAEAAEAAASSEAAASETLDSDTSASASSQAPDTVAHEAAAE